MKPLLYTEEPLCQDGFLACGDSNCIERGLFCNGEKDCADGSDENSCGMYNIQCVHVTFPFHTSKTKNITTYFEVHASSIYAIVT